MTNSPTHLEVALGEANSQILMIVSRSQRLAIELYDAQQVNAALVQENASLTSRLNGATPKSKIVS